MDTMKWWPEWATLPCLLLCLVESYVIFDHVHIRVLIRQARRCITPVPIKNIYSLDAHRQDAMRYLQQATERVRETSWFCLITTQPYVLARTAMRIAQDLNTKPSHKVLA